MKSECKNYETDDPCDRQVHGCFAQCLEDSANKSIWCLVDSVFFLNGVMPGYSGFDAILFDEHIIDGKSIWSISLSYF